MTILRQIEFAERRGCHSGSCLLDLVGALTATMLSFIVIFLFMDVFDT